MSQTIEVTVSPQGETTITTKGFTGGTCREATRSLEAALGIRQSEQMTSEYYAAAPTDQQLPQSQ